MKTNSGSFFCIASDPVRDFYGSNIVTLTVVSASFRDQDLIVILNVVKSGSACTTVARSPLYLANRMEKEVRGTVSGVSFDTFEKT